MFRLFALHLLYKVANSKYTYTIYMSLPITPHTAKHENNI
jgi:hypothetical protein